MTPSEILAELEEHFRERYREVKRLYANSKAANDRLSDEEWLQNFEDQNRQLPQSIRNLLPFDKERILRNRIRQSPIDQLNVDQMASRDAHDLLPYILEYRQEHDIRGNISADEIHLVTVRKHQALIGEALGRFETGLDKVENPTKRALIQLLIDDQKTRQSDVAEFLASESLTEEKWEAYSRRLRERLEASGRRLSEIKAAQIED